MPTQTSANQLRQLRCPCVNTSNLSRVSAVYQARMPISGAGAVFPTLNRSACCPLEKFGRSVRWGGDVGRRWRALRRPWPPSKRL